MCLVSITASAQEKIVLVGDSLMAGYGLSKDKQLPTVLEKNLQAKGYNIRIINGSVSGSTSSGGLNRVKWTLKDSNIDLLILGLGANDMLRGINPEETKKNLESIIQVAQTKNIKVMLAGMLAPTTHGADYKKKFDQIYPTLATQYKLPLIPFLLEGVAMKIDLNQSDGIHPNEKGTLVVSSILEKSIINFTKKNK